MNCSSMSARRGLYLVVLLAPVAIAGCSDGLGKVAGTVTIDNQPVAGGPELYGTVTFTPASGGAPGVGIIDGSGHYSVSTGAQKGVAPGTYLVSIAVRQVKPPTNQDALPQATLISPKKYLNSATSGLREEIKAGSNTCDFALTSDKK